MGKIFGISNLPVSTIMTPFEPAVNLKDPREKEIKEAARQQSKNLKDAKDSFVPKTVHKKSFLNMRNGIGKLMKHFSKKKQIV